MIGELTSRVVAMPELPEVEHARALLEEHCCPRASKGKGKGKGKRKHIEKVVETDPPDEKIVSVGAFSSLAASLEGRVVERVRRKGKYLWLELDARPSVVCHLGMTGSFVVRGVKPASYKSFAVDEEAWPPRFWKVLLEFSDGTEVAYVDARRFGKVHLKQDPESEKPISDLGPDAWLELPPLEDFRALLAKKAPAIKAVLLNQAVLSGIGNWVADEVLVSPTIISNSSSERKTSHPNHCHPTCISLTQYTHTLLTVCPVLPFF